MSDRCLIKAFPGLLRRRDKRLSLARPISRRLRPAAHPQAGRGPSAFGRRTYHDHYVLALTRRQPGWWPPRELEPQELKPVAIGASAARERPAQIHALISHELGATGAPAIRLVRAAGLPELHRHRANQAISLVPRKADPYSKPEPDDHGQA